MLSNTGKKSKWNLSVFITNLSTEKSVEVNGETHVGKLMLDLVEGLGKSYKRAPPVILYHNLWNGCGNNVVFKIYFWLARVKENDLVTIICTLRCG